MLYDETPNYTKLIFMLKKIILNMNKLPGGKYLENQPPIASIEDIDEQTLITEGDPDVNQPNKSKIKHKPIKF
jgi:hypothetical protein